MIHPQRLKKKTCPFSCPRMVAERCCDYGTSAVVEFVVCGNTRVRCDCLGSLSGQVGEKRRNSYLGIDHERCMEDLAQRPNQLRDQLAVRRQAIEQQQEKS